MSNPDKSAVRPNRLPNIRFNPAVVRLPKLDRERRNLQVREALERRVRREYEEMPGLSLTVVQAARLFGLPADVCARILLGLVKERELRRTSDGRYAARIDAA